MKKLDLSIIIVSYNNKDLLKNCLNSLHENIGSSITYEVFVVDNNSHDGTIQMLRELFPEVKVIDNSENLGFAKANNQALALAKGKYFWLLNNDTFVLGGIEKMLNFMDENTLIGALSPKLLEADGKTIQPQGSGNKRQWQALKPIPVSFICGAAFLVRADTYRNVGGLDEKFFFYNEDLDWCKRIKNNNWEIYYYPDAAVIHYGGKSTGYLSSKAVVEGMRGGLYFCRKHYRWLFPLYLIVVSFYLLVGFIASIILMPFNWQDKALRQRISGFAQLIWIIIRGKYR